MFVNESIKFDKHSRKSSKTPAKMRVRPIRTLDIAHIGAKLNIKEFSLLRNAHNFLLRKTNNII